MQWPAQPDSNHSQAVWPSGANLMKKEMRNMKSITPMALVGAFVLSMTLAVGCSSRHEKTTYAPPPSPNVVVQTPPPVVVNPPVSSAEPSTSSTSQTASTYNSSESQNMASPNTE